MSAMFIGEYNHTIDNKGRMIIPVKFREGLGEKFFMTKGLDGCLELYAREEWYIYLEKLSKLPTNLNKAAKEVKRFVLSGATECELDKQGRILVPPSLRSYAHFEKDLVSAGVGDKVEVWNNETWAKNQLSDNIEGYMNQLIEQGYEF